MNTRAYTHTDWHLPVHLHKEPTWKQKEGMGFSQLGSLSAQASKTKETQKKFNSMSHVLQF